MNTLFWGLMLSIVAVLAVRGAWRLPVRIRLDAWVGDGRAGITAGLGPPHGAVWRWSRAFRVLRYDFFPPRLDLEVEGRPPGRRGRRLGRRGGDGRTPGRTIAVTAENLRAWMNHPRLAFSREAARRLEILECDLRADVGTGDALTTALAAAALSAALNGAAGFLSGMGVLAARPVFTVTPHYGGRRLAGKARCIAQFRFGDIMVAGWLAFWDRVSRNLVRGVASPRAGKPA